MHLKIFVLSALGTVRLAAAAMTVGETRCEYAVNPVGIDTPQPRLSWKLTDQTRNQIQTAYQIRVAETQEALEKGGPSTRAR